MDKTKICLLGSSQWRCADFCLQWKQLLGECSISRSTDWAWLSEWNSKTHLWARTDWYYLNHSEPFLSSNSWPVWTQTSLPELSGCARFPTPLHLAKGCKRIWIHPYLGQTAFCASQEHRRTRRWRRFVWRKGITVPREKVATGVVMVFHEVQEDEILLIIPDIQELLMIPDHSKTSFFLFLW